jgi:hypothetical protein
MKESSLKKTNITARLKYIEHITPNIEVNLNALTFLGIDIGNNIPYEYIIPQIIFPFLVSPIH